VKLIHVHNYYIGLGVSVSTLLKHCTSLFLLFKFWCLRTRSCMQYCSCSNLWSASRHTVSPVFRICEWSVVFANHATIESTDVCSLPHSPDDHVVVLLQSQSASLYWRHFNGTYTDSRL